MKIKPLTTSLSWGQIVLSTNWPHAHLAIWLLRSFFINVYCHHRFLCEMDMSNHTAYKHKVHIFDMQKSFHVCFLVSYYIAFSKTLKSFHYNYETWFKKVFAILNTFPFSNALFLFFRENWIMKLNPMITLSLYQHYMEDK